jgi:hypothetical protein
MMRCDNPTPRLNKLVSLLQPALIRASLSVKDTCIPRRPNLTRQSLCVAGQMSDELGELCDQRQIHRQLLAAESVWDCVCRNSMP